MLRMLQVPELKAAMGFDPEFDLNSGSRREQIRILGNGVRRPAIPISFPRVLRRPIESTQYTSEPFQRLMADNGVHCRISRSGNDWDNAAMESFFSTLKTERTARKVYRTRDQARADVFDYIERFYNPQRRHSTIGYLSPNEFERIAATG
jgi:putative transposase